MNDFNFYNPVKLVFGPGKLSTIGDEASKLGKKALIISYKDYSVISPVLDTIKTKLTSADIQFEEFYAVEPNPSVEGVRNAVELCREKKIDLLIAVGGGSVIDTAKSVALSVFYEGDPWVIYTDVTVKESLKEALPIITVSTIPGTSSEMNSGAVLTNKSEKKKAAIFHDSIFPAVSILDAELTCSVPAFLTAAGSADAISHIFESYLNGINTDYIVQDGLQESTFSAIYKLTAKVLENPSNVEARAELQWAITLAHNGWLKAGITYSAPMHLIGHVLSARYNMLHGVTLSILMPGWLKLLRERQPERLKILTRMLPGNATSIDAVEEFEEFLKGINLPVRLSDHDKDIFDDQELELIVSDVVEQSFNVENRLPGKPSLTKKELLELLKTCR